jgi:hypothetical protein
LNQLRRYRDSQAAASQPLVPGEGLLSSEE